MLVLWLPAPIPILLLPYLLFLLPLLKVCTSLDLDLKINTYARSLALSSADASHLVVADYGGARLLQAQLADHTVHELRLGLHARVQRQVEVRGQLQRLEHGEVCWRDDTRQRGEGEEGKEGEEVGWSNGDGDIGEVKRWRYRRGEEMERLRRGEKMERLRRGEEMERLRRGEEVGVMEVEMER
jgi:hypothetical protein